MVSKTEVNDAVAYLGIIMRRVISVTHDGRAVVEDDQCCVRIEKAPGDWPRIGRFKRHPIFFWRWVFYPNEKS